MEADLAEIGIVDVDHDVEIVGIGIPFGIEALPLSILIPVFDLRPALVDVQLAAGHIGEGQHIRIGLLPISGGGDHKQTRILVQQHLGTLTQSTGGAKRGYLGLIGLPVGQLLLDLRHRALAAVAEPGGELGGAFLAQIAVLQLAVAQQPDLAAADRAFLFIK